MRWPFIEERNQPVLTSQPILDRREIVLWAYHEPRDGRWMFQGADAEDPPVETTLGAMLKLDETLAALGALPTGCSASRTALDSEWATLILFSWDLESAVARHEESPNTFRIPSEHNRRSVETDDLVKLLFAIYDNGSQTTERIWVRVTEVTESGYVGVLTKESDCTQELLPGDTVIFGPEHICEISAGDPDAAESEFGNARTSPRHRN